MALRDAFDDLWMVANALDRRMNELFRGEDGFGPGVSLIPFDMFETRDEVVVQAYLPGFRREDVQVELRDGRLTIKAERTLPKRDDVTWLHVEAPYGTFLRTVHIGPAIEADKIEAAWHEGVLMLRLPKAEKARPRLIPIQTVERAALESPEKKAS